MSSEHKRSRYSGLNRDMRVIANADCPRCGAPAGQACRNPVPHDARAGTLDKRRQPTRPHSERRAAWSAAKRGLT